MELSDRLAAIEDIKQLKARYFRFVDTHDWEGLAGVFARDAVFDCTQASQVTPLGGAPVGPEGPVTEGREAIIAFISSILHDKTSVHHGHCHEIVIDSATEAHGVIAMEDDVRAGDRQTRLWYGAGHYYEDYRFEDGAWRIARCKVVRLFSDAAPGAYEAVLEPAAELQPQMG